MNDDSVRAAYRATMVAALKEAEQRKDAAAQQRIRLLIELHDKKISIDEVDEDLGKAL